MSPAEAAALDPELYRPDFPILSTVLHGEHPLVYLDNAASSQRPRQVIQAIVDTYERHYSNVHRGIHWLADQSTDRFEDAREQLRRLINAASVEQIVFTTGTTASINIVARSWGDAFTSAGDEIVLGEMEHHSNIVPWQQLAERRGLTIRWVPVTDEGLFDLDAFDRLLGPRTRLVAVTGVSNVLGTINPVAEIIRRAHAAGARVLVDGAQSVPHEPTDVQALDADFLAFSGHKMLGPSGVGVLYGKRELLEAMPPFLGGGSMIRRVTVDGFEPGDVPKRFEAGTPPIVPAIGFGAAVEYLQRVGMEAIARHERLLLQRAHQRLAEIPGLKILGNAPEKAGIVSFTLEKVHAHDIAQLLDRYGVAVRAGHHCAMPLHKRFRLSATSRASFYFYNTLAEVDAFADALLKVKEFFHARSRRKA